VGRGTGAPGARLAELVAALSLGVDLGFGQPMEHVLRQCLIALRLAGHAGLGEHDRMAVYYSATRGAGGRRSLPGGCVGRRMFHGWHACFASVRSSK
jgi:hypothetical protein